MSNRPKRYRPNRKQAQSLRHAAAAFIGRPCVRCGKTADRAEVMEPHDQGAHRAARDTTCYYLYPICSDCATTAPDEVHAIIERIGLDMASRVCRPEIHILEDGRIDPRIGMQGTI